MSENPVIVWFRNDLRLEDNPAFAAAAKSGLPVAPVFILDETISHAPGAASRWWLHHSLARLKETLAKLDLDLTLRRGEAAKLIPEIVSKSGASSIYWNRRYFADHIAVDKELKSALCDDGVEVETFNGNLLREPWELKTGSGGPYRVFSPFWRSLKEAGPARDKALGKPRKVSAAETKLKSDKLDDWALLPTKPNWAKGFEEIWTPGEAGAKARLKNFLDGPIADYKNGRDLPGQDYTSRLSPHLAFGEISPLQIWQATLSKMESGDVQDSAGYKFLSEVVWREFSYNLLYHNEKLPDTPLREEFKNYPWRDDAKGLKAWQRGRTGYPIVDAGMRQLWQTGWMHNRVRMIVASFLIKDQLIPWQEGEKWFWDTLVDADLANNSASWQWVAGCGADAAPYFRIFNPITQGRKFDPQGEYIREFVPELKDLPDKYVHAPWEAPEDVLKDADVTLGKSYPEPILDHAAARKRALDGYNEIKGD